MVFVFLISFYFTFSITADLGECADVSSACQQPVCQLSLTAVTVKCHCQVSTYTGLGPPPVPSPFFFVAQQTAPLPAVRAAVQCGVDDAYKSGRSPDMDTPNNFCLFTPQISYSSIFYQQLYTQCLASHFFND